MVVQPGLRALTVAGLPSTSRQFAALEAPSASLLLSSRPDQDRYAERARPRGMPKKPGVGGTPAYLPFMWPRRSLRPIAWQACHQAFSGEPTPDHRGLRPPDGWGWCYVDETFIELDHPTQQLGPIPRFAILRRQQTFSRRLIDAHQDASPIDGSSEESRTASLATRLPSQSFHPRQKTRSPAFHATWKPLLTMSPKRTASISARFTSV